MDPTLSALRAAVRDFFERHATDFGLRPGAVDVDYVLNPGGFVNASFRVGDGRPRLHVKLATPGEGQAALERWRALDPLLRRHRAPPVLGWVEIGGMAGTVSPWMDGAPPALVDEVLRAVVDCAAGIWADEEVGERLRTDAPRGAADCYLGVYDDRFRADLAEIAARTPPFLGEADVAWMTEEAERLARLVREDAAFATEVRTAIHGDLWLNNVLWNGGGAPWWLLDWDDLQIGDPAMDLAMLTGPTERDVRPLKRLDVVAPTLPGNVLHRLEVLGRASLLDWVIDPLADWIDADRAPEHQADVRADKERVHREALALYRLTYGS